MGGITALESILKRGPQSGQNLSGAQAEAIEQLLVDRLAPFIAMPVQACNFEEDDWVRADRRWGPELPMRDAVLQSREWRKLFRRRPSPEVRSADGLDRYDLISSGNGRLTGRSVRCT